MQINIETSTEHQFIAAIPELNTLKGIVENNAWHDNDDVYVHIMTVFNNLKKNLLLEFIKDSQVKERLNKYLNQKVGALTKRQILLWCGLLHDIAKPQTIKNNNGVTSCPNHEPEGAVIAKKIFNRLNFSEQDAERLYQIIYNHSVPHQLLNPMKNSEQIKNAAGEVKTKFGDIFIELLFLGLSDTEGCQLQFKNPNEFNFRIKYYYSILNN